MITVGRYALAYLFWAITGALAFVTLLVWRSAAMIALGVTAWDRYASSSTGVRVWPQRPSNRKPIVERK